MPKPPREIAGFVALPIVLPSTVYDQSPKHYLYLKAHEPQIPTEDAARSLFLVNIPVTTTDTHLQDLFATQLDAGRIEQVIYDGAVGKSSSHLLSTRAGKKRKRQTAEDLEISLDIYHLPLAFPTNLHTSGSTAVVVFVDVPSMKLSLKAARRASKTSAELKWGSGLERQLSSSLTGLQRYEAHKTLQYPSRASLLKIVDNYMTGYAALEAARSAENAKKRAEPDEDGFVTVTRGAKGGAVRKQDGDELKARQAAKEKGLEDFYRFQMREKRKEQAGQFLKRFENDKRKLQEMRRRKNTAKPEG